MTDTLEYFTIPDYLEEDFNNILYVDDEESNLRVFDSVFSRYYNIYTANNGETAIRMLHEHKIHMIITDQKMPEMTGTDLLEKILGEFPDIIRIILTGFSDIQAIIKAINKCSIYKYITKPYENADIKEIIDKGMEIYNMRMEKYESANGEAHESNDQAPAFNGNVAEIAANPNLVKGMIEDLALADEDFEGFFDFHINYHLPKEGFDHLFSDFVVNADEEGSKLYFISYQTSANQEGALTYLHIKSKFRLILETHGNELTPQELISEFLSFYDDQNIDFQPSNFKIVTYHWETKEFQYLTQSNNIKLFSVGQQLEPLELDAVESDEDGYILYSAVSEDDLVVYFWDFVLSDDGNEYESANYFNQIVNNATNMPFDLQATQISSGIKSVSKHFSDAALFGLFLNDDID